MSQETVFRIDAVIGGHAAGFKVAAKEAAKAAQDLKREVAGYGKSQAIANREANRAKDTLAKQIVAQRKATEELSKAERKQVVYNASLKSRERLEKQLQRGMGASTIAQATLNEQIKKGVRNLVEYMAGVESATKALHDERDAAIGAAAGLALKGKESKTTEERQRELAAAALEAATAMRLEGKELKEVALRLALKGRESSRTGNEQVQMAAKAMVARKALQEERKELQALNFEFSRHRGVLASNIRSQPLFAVAVASVTAALGPLSSALGDVTAGAVALGGGLEPLLGNLVLLPSIVGAAGQGLLTFGIAFHGVIRTLMAQGVTYQNDLAKLSKPAQAFVETLRGGVIGNAFKELQLQIQTGLFPGLVKGIKNALPLLKPFTQVMYDTSKAIGALAENWGKFFGSKGFGHEFLAIGERNRQTITRIGDAAKYLFDALSKTLVAAGPFIGHFTKWIDDAAKSVDNFITNAKKNGDLRLYFAEVESRTKQWLSILGSTITFFHNLFEAARPLTDTIMNAWVKGAQAASDWAKNSQPLKDFFVSARAPLAALGRLVGALAVGLAQLASENQGNLVQLADALSQHVVPALKAVADFFAKMMPDISKTLASLGDALKTILDHSGDLRSILKEALKAIRGIADAAAFISKKFGGIGLVLVGAATLGGLRTAVSLMKTLIKLGRERVFEQLGIDIVGDNLTLHRGKGLGRMIPGGASSTASKGEGAASKIFRDTTSAAEGAGIGGGAAALIGARAAAGTAFRTASIRAYQIGGRIVERAPLIAAGTVAVDAVIEGIKRRSASQGSAAALTNVGNIITGGMLGSFKNYGAIDKAGNKMLDTIEARVKDIAAKRKLSIPVTFDLNEKGMPNQALNNFVASLETTVSTTRQKTETWKGYFTELDTNVRLNMQRIARETKKGSEDSRVAMAANFNTAASSVMKSMQDAGRFTKKGIETVTKYLRDALALYGIRGRDATAYIQTYINRAESKTGSLGTGANEGNATNKQLGYADGGYVTAPGLRGTDKRHTVLGDGEAVLTHHHQKPVEAALRNTYGFGLRDLFSRDKRKHYMAHGGFVGNKWPMLSGDLDFLPTVGNRLEKMAEEAHIPIFVRSGRRSLSEQAGLFAKYGPGRAARPTPNAPHVRGIAADISPDSSVLGKYADSVGMGFIVPGEPWHIQLPNSFSGSGGGAVAAITQKLKGVIVKMGGAPGLLAQSAVNVVHSVAQGVLNSAAMGADGGGDGSGVPNLGITGKGHPAANMSLAQGMLKGFGWGKDQWPSLKSLWTQESGWDEYAVNKSSGAMGIPQALGHGNVFSLGDAMAQIKWGLNYIKGRYGSPSAAWGHEQAVGWYDTGGIVATAAGRTPPPNIPLNQAPSAPNAQDKPTRAMNPFTKKYETHTRGEWEKIRERYAASKKKKLIGPTGRPPIGKKFKRTKTKPKKAIRHTKKFKGILASLGRLTDLPNLVSGAEFERVAGVLGDQIGTKQKQWDLTDEQQVIQGLFDIASNQQVPAIGSYDGSKFELRDVINWDGGTDASSLNFVPGINAHVAELNENMGMEQNIVKYLGFARDAYKYESQQITDRLTKYFSELIEMSSMVSLWRERKAAAQKQYNKEVRGKGTWQDRVSWNEDEIGALRGWLSKNGSANTDQAKQFKQDAHQRIQHLETQNRHLRTSKPAPSKAAGASLERLGIYGDELKQLTGKTDPAEPDGDVTKWKAGGIVGGVLKTFKGFQTAMTQTTAKIQEISLDDNSGIPAHLYNIDLIKKEIEDWTGTHLPAQAIDTGAGTSSDLNDLLRQQLQTALQNLNLQDMQMSVFRGLAPYIGRFQHGGWVPQTGLAMLERGEYIVPEPDGPNPMYSMQQAHASPVHVTLVLDGHAPSLVKLVDQRIESKAPVVVSQQLGRKGRMIGNAPGRG